MIDPVIFTIELFGREISLRWYGVLVMVGVIVGSLIAERELKRRGENGDYIWDALVWLLPIGIVGARLWFVVNAILGGDKRFLEDPVEIIRIWNGGLHIFGGFLFGAVALLLFLRRHKLDPWLFLDSAGPAVLIGQAIGRIANFINQELYGPPTTLPWGIPIEPQHRLAQYADLNLYPFETTRFHPTFAYEMIWNIAAAGLLLWLSRRYEKELKPGTLFAGWLVLAGIGRTWIEFFRPDQPKIEALGISYSALIAALMALAGAVMLLARYKAIYLAFAEKWEEAYQVSGQGNQIKALVAEEETPSVKKVTKKSKPVSAKKPVSKRSAKGTSTSVKKTTTRTKKRM
ncbi:MAG TPA: prolipoprotein diacylglyceryl transferase [Anaerolineales bacterium]|nr:prolipoprotein diacylglyceryl transferase [Anaerolineales bacterium]